jgi:hypothetical protein
MLALLFTSSRSTADEPAESRRREKGDLAIQSRSILKKYCGECHNGQAGSRGTIAVLDYPKLVASGPNPVPFVLPKNADASQVIQFIEDGTMPPGNRARPTSDEIAVLKKWIAESAPSYPAAFDEQYTLRVMLDDLGRQAPALIPYLRYVSLAHLVGEGPPANLGLVESKLRTALTGYSQDASSALVAVDDCATLFRFDIRSVGWDSRELFFSAAKGAAAGLSTFMPYDLILLEYPHGFRLPPDHPQTARLNQYFKTTRQVQPIPFLRADWLAEKIGKDTPLADDLKSLIDLRQSLEKEGSPALGLEKKMPCGPKLRAFADRDQIVTPPRGKACRFSRWERGIRAIAGPNPPHFH